MEYRNLEINVMYAKGLSKVNLFSRMKVYVVVSLDGEYNKNNNSKQKTKVDKDGDTQPSWNFPMKFTVDEAALQQNHLTLFFNVRCYRALGDKDIGEVHVPVKGLFDVVGEGKQHQVSYQVRTPFGRLKGELTFSFKFGGKAIKLSAMGEPVTAYPAHPMVGSTSGYKYPPPYGAAPVGPYPPPTGGYPAPEKHSTAATVAGYGYPQPPQQYVGYPQPPPQYGGYPQLPPQYGGYPQLPPSGYGYGPQSGYGYQLVQKPPRKNNLGLGLGAGLLGGALGGLLIGDMVSDATAFDAGYDDGLFDAGF